MRARICAAAAAILLAGCASAGAHEIGKTQVTALIDPARHTYQFDLVVDPDALLTRLQIRETGDVAPPRDREDRDRRISALGAVVSRLRSPEVRQCGGNATLRVPPVVGLQRLCTGAVDCAVDRRDSG